MNIFRVLGIAAAVSVIAGCSVAPPSSEENPYYTTKPLKPVRGPGNSSYGDNAGDFGTVITSPIGSPPEIVGTPLTLPPMTPGKTLPSPAVIEQPGGAINVNSLARFDLNNDGVVTVQEMLQVNLSKMMTFDRNGDGYLDENEFIAATSDRRNRNGASSAIFKNLDTNRDGKLSSKELAAYLTPSIAALDPNNTGIVRSLSPVPDFPEPASPPPASTITAGSPRLQSPGAVEHTRARPAPTSSKPSSVRKVAPAQSKKAVSKSAKAPVRKAAPAKPVKKTAKSASAPVRKPAKKASSKK